jgi:pimeloyl-ACP methyl ester carboxylesterase
MPRVRVAPDLEMYYESQGNGPSLLFFGATAYPAAIWKYQAPLSSELRLITHDYRGVGHTDHPDVPYTTAQFANDAVGLLDALGIDRVHVLGHSMGGRVAQYMALDHPDRIASLILCGSGPGQFEGANRWTKGIPLNMAVQLTEDGFEGYQHHHVCQTDAVFGRSFRTAHPESVEQAYRIIFEALPSVKCYLRHVIARQEHQTTERLSEISCPTLVVVGSEDDETHLESSPVLAHGIPGAEFVMLNGRGHCHFWEDPEETNKLILDWVRRHKG